MQEFVAIFFGTVAVVSLGAGFRNYVESDGNWGAFVKPLVILTISSFIAAFAATGGRW